MYTIAFLTRRVAGMSAEDFAQHYRTTHFALSSQLPGLVSYHQHLIDHTAPWGAWDEAFPDHDALSLYTFTSREAAEAAFVSTQGVATDADTPTFMSWEGVLAVPATRTASFVATQDAHPGPDTEAQP